MTGSKMMVSSLTVGLLGVFLVIVSGDSSSHPRANFKGTPYQKPNVEHQALESAPSSEVEYVDGPLAPLYDFLIERRLQRFCKLLRDSGLEQVIQDIGDSWTLFAPTDASFIFLPGGTLEELQRNPQLLRDFILYHFVAGDFPSSQIQNELMVNSVQGSPLRFNIYGQSMTVSGAEIVEPDLLFEMGRVHIVDRPLYPIPSEDLVTYLQRNYREMYRLLVDAGLIDYLSSGTFTLLVPDDQAFDFLSVEFKEALATNISLAERILLNHILPGSVYTGGITDGMQWETVGGNFITFTIKRGLTFANGVPIVLPDIPLTNGVLHVLNRVLLPEGIDADCQCKPSKSNQRPGQIPGSSRPSFGQTLRPPPGQGTTRRPWQSPSRQTPPPAGQSPNVAGPRGSSVRPQNPATSPEQPGNRPRGPSRTGQPIRPVSTPNQVTGSPHPAEPLSDDEINSVVGTGVQPNTGQKRPEQTRTTRYPPPPRQRPAPRPPSQGISSQTTRPPQGGTYPGSENENYPEQDVSPPNVQTTRQTDRWSNRQQTPVPGYPTPQRGSLRTSTTRRPLTTRAWNQPRVSQPTFEQPNQDIGIDTTLSQEQGGQTHRPVSQTTSWQQRKQVTQPTRQPTQRVTFQPNRPQPPQRRTTVRPTVGRTSVVPQDLSNEQPFDSTRQQQNCRRQGERVTTFTQNLPLCSQSVPDGCQYLPYDPTDQRPLCPESETQDCRQPNEPYDASDDRPVCPSSVSEDCREFGQPTYVGDRRPLCTPSSEPRTGCKDPSAPYNPSDRRPVCRSTSAPNIVPPSTQTISTPESCRRSNEATYPGDRRSLCTEEPQQDCRPFLERPKAGDRRPICKNNQQPSQSLDTTKDSDKTQSKPDSPHQQTTSPQRGQYPTPTTRRQSWQGTTRTPQSWQGTTRTPQSWQGTTRTPQSWQGTARTPQSWQGTTRTPQSWQATSQPIGKQPQSTPHSGTHAQTDSRQPGSSPLRPQPGSNPSEPIHGTQLQPDFNPSQPELGQPDIQPPIGTNLQPPAGPHPSQPQSGRYPSQQPGRIPSPQQPGRIPSQQQPGRIPSQQQPGRIPSQQQPSRIPSQPGRQPSQPQPGPHEAQPQTDSYPSQPESGTQPGSQTQPGSHPSGTYPSQQPGSPQSGSYPSQPQSGVYPSRPQSGSARPSQPTSGQGQSPQGRPTPGHPQRQPGFTQTWQPRVTTPSPQHQTQSVSQPGSPGFRPNQPFVPQGRPSQPVTPARTPISVTGTSTTPGEDTRRSLYEIVEDPSLLIRGRPVQLTKIFALFHKAGIEDILTGPGPTTVFLPSDDAFALLPKGVIEQLEENPELLRQVLLYHVTNSEILPSAQPESYTIPSLEGNQLLVTMLNGGRLIFISGAKAVAVTRANNGIFYVINQLLYPLPHHDIVGAIQSRPDLSTLAYLLPLSGLETMLRGQTPYTLLAPTDNAFAQLPQSVYDELTRNTTALQEILLHHVIEGAHYGREFFTGGTFPSARGGKLKFQVVSYGYQVNDVNIKTPEIVTGTGVIHLIDQVLLEDPDLQFFTAIENSLAGEGGLDINAQQPGGGNQEPGIGGQQQPGTGGHQLPGIGGRLQPVVRDQQPGAGQPNSVSPRPGGQRFPTIQDVNQPQIGGLQPSVGQAPPVGRIPAHSQTRPGNQPASPGQSHGVPVGTQRQPSVGSTGQHNPGQSTPFGGRQPSTPGGRQPTQGQFQTPRQPTTQPGHQPQVQQNPGRPGHTSGNQRSPTRGQRPQSNTFNQRRPIIPSANPAVPGGNQEQGGQANNVADLARSMGLNKFANWVTNTGLLEKIHDGGVYTVFAPTDDAVSSLPQDMVYSIDSDPEQVKPILEYHIVPQRLNLNSVTNEETASTLLQGKNIRFNVYANSQPDCKQLVTASGTPLGEALATMGSIQVIPVTQVLYQPSGNLQKIIEASPILQRLNDAIKTSRLTWVLSGTGPMTIFAPSDTAFAALTEEQKKTLIDDKQAFSDLLKSHIVRGTYFSSGIQEDIDQKSENNKPMKLSLQEGILTVNSIPVTYSDITATNGVLHVIDHFL